MLIVRLAGDHLYGKLLFIWLSLVMFHLAVIGDIYDGVFSCCPFSHEMSWMRSWTSLSQFFFFWGGGGGGGGGGRGLSYLLFYSCGSTLVTRWNRSLHTTCRSCSEAHRRDFLVTENISLSEGRKTVCLVKVMSLLYNPYDHSFKMTENMF